MRKRSFFQFLVLLLLWGTGAWIVSIFLWGGFVLESAFGPIRCLSIKNPIIFQLMVFTLGCLFNRSWRNNFFIFMRSMGAFWFIVFVIGVLGWTLWVWNFYFPGRFWEWLGGRMNIHAERQFKHVFLFMIWILTWLMIFLAYWRTRISSESFVEALNRVVRDFKSLILMFVLLILEILKVKPEFQFLTFTALVGLIGYRIGWSWPASDENPAAVQKWVGWAVGLFSIVFLVLTQQRLHNFRIYEDFPMFAQALWSTLHGKWMYVTGWIFDNGGSFFGFHFQPFLIFLLPFYALWKGPELLYAFHVLALVLAALPLYGFVKDRLGKAWLGFAFALVYLHSPFIQRGIMHDFHPEDFVPLFFFSAVYFFHKKKRVWFGVMCLLLLSLREDCFIHVCVLGGYALIFERQWKMGIGILSLGILWGGLSFEWVIPYFKNAPSHVFMDRYGHMKAEGLIGLAVNMLQHPDVVLKWLTRHDALVGKGLLSIPLFLLPWLSLRGLFFILVFNLYFFLASESNVRYLESSYVFFILPAYFIAAVLSAQRIALRFQGRGNFSKKFISGLCGYLIASAIVFNFFFNPIDHYRYGPSDYDVLVKSPLGKKFDVNFYKSVSRAKTGHAILKQYIPDGVSLATQIRFATHLANRFVLKYLPTSYHGVEYIFMDLLSEPVRKWSSLSRAFMARLLMESPYGVVVYRQGYAVLKKDYPKDINSKVMRELFYYYYPTDFHLKRHHTKPDSEAYLGWSAYAGENDYPFALARASFHHFPKAQYRLIFCFKVLGRSIDDPIAKIFISGTKSGEKFPILTKILSGGDFHSQNSYQDFIMDLDARGLDSFHIKIEYLGHGNIAFGGMKIWAPQITDEEIYRYLTS